MKTQVKLTKRLLSKYPNVKFFTVTAQNLSNKQKDVSLEKEKKLIEKKICKIKDSSKIPIVRKDNVFFKNFGKTNPIQYQLDSIKGGKEIPTDSVLKDILFITEMKHYCLVSGHDLDTIKDTLIFDITDGDEPFTNIANKKQDLVPNDIILKQNNICITSLLYGQDNATKITDKTKNTVYFFWFFGKVTDSESKSMINTLVKYLKGISQKKSTIETFKVKEIEESLGQEFVVTPWEVKGDIDYNRLIVEFGTKPITNKLLKRIESNVGELHHFLTRKIFFSHRDMDFILNEYEKGNKFALYTGRGPSGTTHIGHLVPWMFTKWIQDKFGSEFYFQIVDDEKFLVKDLTLEQTTAYGYDNALDLIALGFKPKKTKIIINTEYSKTLYKIALKIAKRITYSQAKGVFGFTNQSNIGIIFYTSMQAAPCFLPSVLKKKNIPVLIPAAIDQDAYWRGIAREVAPKLGYYKPAQIHNRFLPGLGTSKEKMSASQKHTAIFTTDTPQEVKKKIMKYAFSGGQDTLKKHRELGRNPDVDYSYQWLSVFEKSDKKLEEVYHSYKNGDLLSGELKQMLIDKLNKFLTNHQKERIKAKKHLEKFMLRD